METLPPVSIWDRLAHYSRYWIPFALFAFSLLIYVGAMNGEMLFSWDDNRYITENPLLRDFPSGVDNIFTESYFAAYIPLTIFSYALEFTVWGLDPTGYHVVNIILHAINGVLVFYLVARLQERRSVALIASLLFIAHPIQTENVAWISQRKSLLSLLFFLLAWLAHIRSRKPQASFLWLVGAWVLFLCSVLSKPTAVGAGILFMLYDYFWAQKKIPTLVLQSLPYWIVGVVGSILIVVAHEEHDGIKGGVFDNFDQRMGILMWTVWDYAVSLVNPFTLNNMYVYFPQDVTLSNPRIWLGVGILLLLLLFAVFEPLGRPHSLFAVMWVGVMMLPVSNLIPIAIQRADRYMYFPSIVIFMLVGIACMKIWDRVSAVEARHLMMLGAGGILATCIILTHERNEVWTNSDTLWADHLQDYPTSETGLLNRGVYFYRYEDWDTASSLFTELVRLYPNHYKGNRFMGHISRVQGNFEAAARYYDRAILVNPQNNDLTDDLSAVLIELGVAAFNQGDYALALQRYEQAAKYDPTQQVIYNNIGYTLFNLQEYAAAIEAYDLALSLNPSYTRAMVNRADAALALSNYEIARASYRDAVNNLNASLDAKSWSNFCLSSGEMGDNQNEAIQACERAVEMEPLNALFWGRTAHVLLLFNQPEEALAAAEQALSLNQNLSLSHRTYADANALLGNVELARQAYTRALELDPSSQAAQKGLAQLDG